MKHCCPFRTILSLALTVMGSGCATVVHGTTQEVTFSSDPLGATVFVDGVNVGITPTAATLARDQSHSVRIEKPGYVPYGMTTVTIESALTTPPTFDPVSILMFAADHNSGGAYEIRPTDISAQLIRGVTNPTAKSAIAPTSAASAETHSSPLP